MREGGARRAPLLPPFTPVADCSRKTIVLHVGVTIVTVLAISTVIATVIAVVVAAVVTTVIAAVATVPFVACASPFVASAASSFVLPLPAFAAHVLALALVVRLRRPRLVPCLEVCQNAVVGLALFFGGLAVRVNELAVGVVASI